MTNNLFRFQCLCERNQVQHPTLPASVHDFSKEEITIRSIYGLVIWCENTFPSFCVVIIGVKSSSCSDASQRKNATNSTAAKSYTHQSSLHYCSMPKFKLALLTVVTLTVLSNTMIAIYAISMGLIAMRYSSPFNISAIATVLMRRKSEGCLA